MTETLLVRADGGPRVGAGHLMRSLAVAQAFQERGGRAVFAIPRAAEPFVRRLESEDVAVHLVEQASSSDEDAERTIALARREGARHVMIDGYCFTSSFVRAVVDAGLDVLVVDDNGDYDAYPSRLVLNPNLHASRALYPMREGSAGLLLGLDYTPLRRELRYHRPRRAHVASRASRVLVTLGGSDPDDTTSAVLRALDTLDAADETGALEVRVIVGPAFAHPAALEATLASIRLTPEVVRDARDMSAHYAWADACVAGSGSTTWELLALGVPRIAIVLAENQRAVGASLSERGAALVADGAAVRRDPSTLHAALATLLFDPDARATQLACGRALVDGEGAARVAAALASHPLHLRQARPEDAAPLFAIANDPDVRAVSLRTEPIEWEKHLAWLAARLSDPATRFFVAELTGGADIVGYVRFQLEGVEAEISIAFAAAERGRGFGGESIRQGVRTLHLLEPTVERVRALILPDNHASIRAFERAGFAPSGDAICGGRVALSFVTTL